MGLTWIELLVLFEITTGQLVSVKGRMEEELTIDMMTRALKKRVGEVAKTSVQVERRRYFEAPGKTNARLFQIGIRTVTGGIRARPVLSEETQAAVNAALLRYRGTTKPGDIDRAFSGDLACAIRHVKGCAKPLWRGHIEADARRYRARNGYIQWRVRCATCDTAASIEHKPGSPEELRRMRTCEHCRRSAPGGELYRCGTCDDDMMQCTCIPVDGEQPPGPSARGLRLLRALRAARARAGRDGAAA